MFERLPTDLSIWSQPIAIVFGCASSKVIVWTSVEHSIFRNRIPLAHCLGQCNILPATRTLTHEMKQIDQWESMMLKCFVGPFIHYVNGWGNFGLKGKIYLQHGCLVCFWLIVSHTLVFGVHRTTAFPHLKFSMHFPSMFHHRVFPLQAWLHSVLSLERCSWTISRNLINIPGQKSPIKNYDKRHTFENG